MKRYLVLICLAMVFPASAHAQSWSSTVEGWNTMPSWHAEYREGTSTTIVDTVNGVGQRIQQSKRGYVVATRYIIWSGSQTGSWTRYNGIDKCYRQGSNIAPWTLDKSAMSLAMNRNELMTNSPLSWSWSDKNVNGGWSLQTNRTVGSYRANVTVTGSSFGKIIRVKVRSGNRIRQSSSTRVRRLVQLSVGVPTNTCSSSR